MVKKLFIALLVIIALVLVAGAFMPTTWRVEQSIEIAAAPEAIHPFVNRLERWSEWATGESTDDSLKYEYEGPAEGVGAIQRWSGTASRGELKITASDPETGIEFDLALEGDEVNAKGSIRYTPGDGTTRVTWTDDGDIGMVPIGGYMVPLLEAALNEHFTASLSKLEALVEGSDVEAGEETASDATGTIRVKVAYEGDVPAAQPLRMEADPYCAKNEKTNPATLVNDGMLENVAVRISGTVRGTFEVPAESVVVDQTECMYTPRVTTAFTGQTLEIQNADETLHNVHSYKGDQLKNWFNNAQPPGAPAISKKVEPGMAQFKCDVHPWMTAWVFGSPHPFHAVTGKGGEVTFTDVPASSRPYPIETWHEVFGQQITEVEVKPDEVSEITVTYRNTGTNN